MNAPLKSTDKSAKVTPMMAQYLSIKSQVGEAVLLFYRMGDFYELFFGDAVSAAAALDIALTKRGKHKGNDIPMCGVPVHAAETYLQRLIKKGFRVAVCEQTESPAEAKKRGSKSVVRREVVRTVTPGTLTEDSLLDARNSNFITAVFRSLTGDMALAWADVSDGAFQVCELSADRLPSEIAALSPREIILPESLYHAPEFLAELAVPDAALTPLPGSKFDRRHCEERLLAAYNVKSLDGFGAFNSAEISAAGALIDYIALTQAGDPVRLTAPQRRQTSGFMAIDPATRASLEIDRTQQGRKQGSLLSVIDRTVTGPGARCLAERLNRPLVDVGAINRRLDAVSVFADHHDLRADLRTLLKSSGDLARSTSRIALGRGGPRDIRAIYQCLSVGEDICRALISGETSNWPDNIQSISAALSAIGKGDLKTLKADIETAFQDDVPILARDGNFIASGWHKDLDDLKQLRDDSRRVVAGLQAEYAKEADVQTLKIKHNNVLGYFIEVTPKYADHMLAKGAESPFIHRQTLVSGVRFTTTELGELDAKISGAGDKALALELEIFQTFVQQVTDLATELRRCADALARLDTMAALAEWAADTGATRPLVDDSSVLDIEDGRHPVVDAVLKSEGSQPFTANDCRLDAEGRDGARLTIITGPNMAGKSTYLRQNALMFILAQAGSFVPAVKAHIGVADSLFSRVGASDDLSKGRSTFMSEMIETAAILNLSGPRSFVILDEIGRGTATFDGLSIAWATAEHLHTVNQARALFATHYHELTDLAETLDFGSNACLHAKEWDGDLIFLHDVRPGAADKSYGVQVAKLAGLPETAVARARDVLAMLEDNHDNAQDRLGGLPLFNATPTPAMAKPSEIDVAIDNLDVDELSPRAALDLLYELKAKRRGNPS